MKVGRNKRTGDEVAIKIMPKTKGAKNGNVEQERMKRRQRVQNEIDALLRLQGIPGIVNLLDVFEDEQQFYLVFEKKPMSLFQFINENGILPEEKAKKIFGRLSFVVSAMHSRNIAHRDIKLENILIDPQNLSVFLCDFGSATFFCSGQKKKERCGSPFTVAPEVLKSEAHAPELVDVWALGSVLFTMICGRFPFQAKTMQEVYRRTVEGKVKFPAGLSPVARDLISRCMMVDADRRLCLEHVTCHPFLWHEDESDDEPQSMGDSSSDSDEFCDDLVDCSLSLL